MEIKVIKSSDNNHWYADRIGETFLVLRELKLKYHIKTKLPSIGYFYVLKEDCEVIK